MIPAGLSFDWWTTNKVRLIEISEDNMRQQLGQGFWRYNSKRPEEYRDKSIEEFYWHLAHYYDDRIWLIATIGKDLR